MRVWARLAAGLVFVAHAAHAGVGTNALSGVGVEPAAGARLPLEAVWQDEHGANVPLGEALGGRPAILIFADFTCRTLCGPVLSAAAGGLSRSSLTPMRDYRLVVLGLDPKDSAADAAAMRQQIGDGPVASAAVMLRAGETEVQRAAAAVGYRFTYDAAHDQFAHPAAALVLAPDGRVTRVLSGLGLTPEDLTLALVEAGQGRIGTLGQRVHLLCYGFDPAAGVYTLAIYRIVGLAWGIGAVLLAGGIAALALWPPRRPT